MENVAKTSTSPIFRRRGRRRVAFTGSGRRGGESPLGNSCIVAATKYVAEKYLFLILPIYLWRPNSSALILQHQSIDRLIALSNIYG